MLQNQVFQRKWKAIKGKLYGDYIKNHLRAISVSDFFTKVGEKETIRFHRSDDKCSRIIIRGTGDLQRIINEDIENKVFEKERKKHIGAIVEKNIYIIIGGKYTVEIDDYFTPVLEQAVIIDINFLSRSDSEKFDIQWFFKDFKDFLTDYNEIDDINAISNHEIAIHGFVKYL